MGESRPPVSAGEERVAIESEHLAAIVRSSDDAILSKDRDAVITSWNDGARRLYGYTSAEAVGRRVTIIIPPERHGEELEIVRKVLAGERVEHYETERVRKDGTRIRVSLTASPIHDESGEITGVSTHARNLSQTSLALIDATQRLEGAFRTAPIGMCTFQIVDGAIGPIEQANDEMTRLLGYTEDELRAITAGDLTHPDHALRERRLLEELAAGTRTTFGIEKRNRHRDGHWVWIWATVSVVEGEEPRTALAHMLDITERKETEQELERVRENLERSNAELDQFAYVASHDLKEPLILVSAYARMLRERHGHELDEEGRTFLGHVIDEAARMKTMIDDLLDYSRLETRAEETTAPVDVAAAAEAALRTLGPQVAEAGASVEIRPPLPVVEGSATQFERLMRNLLANAIKFRGDEPPVVDVSAEQTERGWVVSVRDNGIGIDPGQEERIFDVFHRLHGEEQFSGSGMGLAICKRIVQRHGGRIWAERGEQGGSVFKFALPA